MTHALSKKHRDSVARRPSASRRGFTLIELLLVIGIIANIAAVVIVAINPRRQLLQAHNAARVAFANQLQKAVHQYMIDFNGTFPEPTKILEGEDNVIDVCRVGEGAHIDCVNLDDELIPVYLVSFQQDGAETCPYKIGYTIGKVQGGPTAASKYTGILEGDVPAPDCVDNVAWSASASTQGNDDSQDPSLSSDGTVLFFDSQASTIVAGDSNGAWDVFAMHRATQSLARMSVATDGTQGNGDSVQSSPSSNGRYVSFLSDATNLIAGDTNGFRDVFLRDRDTDGDGNFDEAGAVSTVLVSADTGGGMSNESSGVTANPPSISADGGFVAFDSRASDLVGFDVNGVDDVFVRDMNNSSTIMVSLASDATQGNGASNAPSMSANGRYVVFQSAATNLVSGDTNGAVDIFLRDRDGDNDGVLDEVGASPTIRVSVGVSGAEGNGNSLAPVISGDGRYIAFLSDATNLVPSDNNGVRDVFVYDTKRKTTIRVSVATGGTQANGASSIAVIDSTGRHIAFESVATNLVAGDTNGKRDIFVHDRRWGITWRMSSNGVASQSTGDSYGPAISGIGSVLTYFSTDSVVAGDTNGFLDVQETEIAL